MNWKKLGNIYEPYPKNPYLASHASNPVAVPINSTVFRIYYSSRDTHNRSSVSSFDFDMAQQKVVSECSKSLFVFGLPNSFFSHGVSIGCTYEVAGEPFLLFMGWQIPDNQHWRGDIGRLKLLEDGSLSLNPELPLLTVDDNVDTLSLSYPWVLYEDGIYKMWYGSTVSWTSENGEMIHVINYATSLDGINWNRHGQAIPHEMGIAQAFSRPSVLRDDKGYHAWFSYRSGDGTSYRIGYAQSNDGLVWQLALEKSGINVARDGWDSEMICYPFVFDFRGNRYMLYNGNGFGKSGIGLAVLDK